MERPNERAKNWVFTMFNYEHNEDYIRQINKLKEADDVIWMIYGHETAPTTGEKHLQGAVCFNKQYRKKQITKRFDYRIHFDVMRGTPQESKNYCTKEDTTGYFERGIMPVPGSQKTKENWDLYRKLAEQGKFNDIPSKIWVRYHSALKAIRAESLKDESMEDIDDLKKHFLWLWGPTGTGKSHTARRIAKELAPDEEPYLKDLNKWWGNYKCQKVTIIEEADEKRCEHLASFFKKWCDKWSFTAEGKGISYDEGIRPNYVIVTSNYEIRDCFKEPADYEPLERRFTIVKLERRDQYVYWPKTQMELELEKEANKDGLWIAPTGNSENNLGAIQPEPESNQGPEEEEESNKRQRLE